MAIWTETSQPVNVYKFHNFDKFQKSNFNRLPIKNKIFANAFSINLVSVKKFSIKILFTLSLDNVHISKYQYLSPAVLVLDYYFNY